MSVGRAGSYVYAYEEKGKADGMTVSTINRDGRCHGLVRGHPGMGGGGMEW